MFLPARILRITLTGVAPRRMLDRMKSPQPTWKTKPELTAHCPSCSVVFPLGYNFCPYCGTALKYGTTGAAQESD